jgi:CRP-like cAMP-binding protein
MTGRNSLEGMRILSSLAAAEIAALNRRCHWRRLRSKEWLLHQSHAGTDTYFLTDGALRMIINSPDGSDVIIADLKSGDYFGEMSTIDGQPQSAGIVAISESTVASIPAAVFRELLHTHPEIIERVLRDIVSRMRLLHQRVSELHTMPVRHRIYAELLRRADPIDEHRSIISSLPRHAEIAARVGTRRETVARELKALERAGLFTKSGGAFVLTDRDILQKAS